MYKIYKSRLLSDFIFVVVVLLALSVFDIDVLVVVVRHLGGVALEGQAEVCLLGQDIAVVCQLQVFIILGETLSSS